MLKNTLQAIIGVGFFIWAKWFASSDLQPELFGMAIGIGAALLVEVIFLLIREWVFLCIYFNCYFLKRKSPLRLSMAYLFKIEVNGKYLLVKNKRFDTPTYQPVGGVYKYFHPEAKKSLNSMSVVTDNAIENDEKSEFDLRLRMTARKNIRRFIKWFFSSVDREIDPWREFYEELIAKKILPEELFPYIYYDLLGQHFEPIHFDEYFKVDTLKYVDVFTPRFVNQRQREALKKLLTVENDEFIWVTEEEIGKKFSKDGRRISDHAHKIFHTKKIG